MMRTFLCIGFSIAMSNISLAQNVKFTEFDLPNGLHVILHQDNKAPVVVTSVLYHVGSKNEQSDRTGFAHFFEHLLFEGTPNIKPSSWFKIVSSNGGENNANTTQDRTYYYEVFPSNQLELGLYLESERLLHPIISTEGVETQREVVKEEKRMRVDNQPYGRFQEAVSRSMFDKHPYKGTVIGSMEHLNAAKLEEFQNFLKKFYVPSNAVLVVAGDINVPQAKALVTKYFGEIPKAKENVVYNKIAEAEITSTRIDTMYDANIQLPAVVTAYRTLNAGSRDAKVMRLISTYLSGGASGKIRKLLVDEKQMALQAASIPNQLEDYGIYINFALPNGDVKLNDLVALMDQEIDKVCTQLISDTDYKKIMNIVENQFIDNNNTLEGVAYNLAEGYAYFKNTNNLNTTLKTMQTITKEEIRTVAAKYLQKNKRLVLYYLPEKK
jgi:zinc protease